MKAEINIHSSKKKELKTKSISVRCTESEYERLKTLAEKNNKKISDYILDEKIALRKRVTKKDRSRMTTVVELQQRLNELMDLASCKDIDEEMKSRIKDFAEDYLNLWE